MSDVVFGIPPEVLLTRASESSVLPDLYFLFYRTASAACQDMSEVIVRAQVIQFGCLWNAVDKGTCFGSSCCVMEHPVLLADTESPDSPFGSGVIDWDIPIGQKYL